MKSVKVPTKARKQVVDLTPILAEEVRESGLGEGLCHVFVRHTTACVTTACLDPGTDLDLLDALEAMVPRLSYRHPHDPSHVGDHINSSIVGPDVTVPFRDGSLLLGTWQSVVLVELDGPREREVVVSLFPSA